MTPGTTDRSRSRDQRAWWTRIALPTAGLTVLGLLAIIGWLLLRSDTEGLEPIVTVDQAGDTIVYSGRVRDAVARARIIEAFNSVPITAEDGADEGTVSDSAKQATMAAARAARQEAVDALARLYAEPADPGAVVEAMNRAIIDFEAASAELPVDAAGFIQAAAEAIQRTPRGTRIVVAGHAHLPTTTDGVGSFGLATELALAAERAAAVMAALVDAGADRERLGAEARGSQPAEGEPAPDVLARRISFVLAEVGEPDDADDQSESASSDSSSESSADPAADVREAESD